MSIFVTVEGVEGVGKSTVMQFLREQLSAAGVSYVVTREPGGTPIAEDIRHVLLSEHEEVMSPDVELLLMFAGRAQNVSQVISPALQRGQWVLSDRFTDATFAYQGGGRGIAHERISELSRWVLGDFQPDLTLLLDAPVEIGFERIKKRGVKDRIESEGIEFFDRVRQSYLNRAAEFPDRFRIIQANQELSLVQKEVLEVIKPMIALYL